MQEDFFIYPKSAQLNRHQRNGSIEKAEHIEKARCDLFCNDNGSVVPLGTTLAFDIPILNCPDDMTLIKRTEHNFDFIINFFLIVAH